MDPIEHSTWVASQSREEDNPWAAFQPRTRQLWLNHVEEVQVTTAAPQAVESSQVLPPLQQTCTPPPFLITREGPASEVLSSVVIHSGA